MEDSNGMSALTSAFRDLGNHVRSIENPVLRRDFKAGLEKELKSCEEANEIRGFLDQNKNIPPDTYTHTKNTADQVDAYLTSGSSAVDREKREKNM